MLDTSYVLQNAGQCSQFQDCPTLCQTQSGFKQGHSTITAAMSVTNDIITALDGKKIMCCTLYWFIKSIWFCESWSFVAKAYSVEVVATLIIWLEGLNVCP